MNNISDILIECISSARNDTGNLYYDKTYPKLLEAGGKLKLGQAGEIEILTLAHGIAGWNRGYGSAPNAEALIRNLKDTSKLANLARSIINVERGDRDSSDLVANIDSALINCQEILNIKTNSAVTVASKLLHFFSPYHFPPLDANVVNALENNGKTDISYSDYAASLIDIGVADFEPLNSNLSVYWSWLPVVTPIRAIDCTLYVAGKR